MALHLALAAMVLRALLPAGWMPAAHAASAIPLVICSVDGVRKILPAHGPVQPAHAHGVCPFAAAAPLAPDAAPVAVATPVELSQIAPRHFSSARCLSRIPASAAPRGPPSLA